MARRTDGPPRCIGRAPKVPLLSDRRAGGTCGKEKLVPTVAGVAPHIHDGRTDGRAAAVGRSVHPSVLGEERRGEIGWEERERALEARTDS